MIRVRYLLPTKFIRKDENKCLRGLGWPIKKRTLPFHNSTIGKLLGQIYWKGLTSKCSRQKKSQFKSFVGLFKWIKPQEIEWVISFEPVLWRNSLSIESERTLVTPSRLRPKSWVTFRTDSESADDDFHQTFWLAKKPFEVSTLIILKVKLLALSTLKWPSLIFDW